MKGRRKNLAKYRCTICGCTWRQLPEPVECRACGELYVEWVNYERWCERDEGEDLCGTSVLGVGTSGGYTSGYRADFCPIVRNAENCGDGEGYDDA